jgi:hypothetical protein
MATINGIKTNIFGQVLSEFRKDAKLPKAAGLKRHSNQNTIRVLNESGSLTFTNVPIGYDLPDQDALERSTTGSPYQPNGSRIARGGSCLSQVPVAIGWIFMAFGVLFVCIAAIATLVFDVPFRFNGQPAGKPVAASVLGGFLLVWVLFCTVWIYLSRNFTDLLGGANRYWRLVLEGNQWVCFRADQNQEIGRCDPADIENLSVSSWGYVIAEQIGGKSTQLSGRLSPFEAAWLRNELAKHLRQPMIESASRIHPFVPLPSSRITPGQTLNWRLPRADAPWLTVFGLLAVCLFWNGITSVFVWQAFFGEAKFDWFLGLFMIPFVLVGTGLIIAFVSSAVAAIVQSRIGKTTVELQAMPLVIGRSCQALVTQSGPLSLRKLIVQLVCEEQATYRQGTSTRTDTKKVCVLDVFEDFDIRIETALPLECRFELQVPADVMHSFDAPHNKIVWKLLVRGEPENWGSYVREYPIVIGP